MTAAMAGRTMAGRVWAGMSFDDRVGAVAVALVFASFMIVLFGYVGGAW